MPGGMRGRRGGMMRGDGMMKGGGMMRGMRGGMVALMPLGIIVFVLAFLIGGKTLMPLIVLAVILLGGGGFMAFGPMRRMGMMQAEEYEEGYQNEDKEKRDEGAY